MKSLLSFILFCIFSTTLAAEITGMFSSFKLGISGDLTGMEVHIVPNPIGYSVVVHGSEGAAGFPRVYKITKNKNIINFTVPKNSGSGFAPGKWKGTILNNKIKLSGPYRSYVLPRKSSYWQ